MGICNIILLSNLWVRLRSYVHDSLPLDLADICQWIEEACLEVTGDEMERLYVNIVRKIVLCIGIECAYFEEIL